MNEVIFDQNIKIGIIGLGYVGLPLASVFGRYYDTVGFDVKKDRIQELSKGIDKTLEVSSEELSLATRLNFTDDPEVLKNCNFYIVTVPTPIDKHNRPDLTPLLKASESVGKVLKKGDIVVYESTVYPGCTEEDCVPVLEKHSNLKYNQDFFCGYSPERINPGDKEHSLTKIKKVVSGSDDKTADIVDNVYKSIITAGTHRAPSIKIAEAAKVIENAQRDINIAFINELSLIFDKIGISTQDVLEASATKWNFLNFKPGLVGGHCIGVDPYYLTHKAQELGYHPEVILSGRKINDNMGMFIANKVIKLMIRKEIIIKNAEILVLGITFKENCPDIRNSKVIDVIKELEAFGCKIDVYDPWAEPEDVLEEYGLNLIANPSDRKYDAVIGAVPHSIFKNLDIFGLKKEKSIVYDIKWIFDKYICDGRL